MTKNGALRNKSINRALLRRLLIRLRITSRGLALRDADLRQNIQQEIPEGFVSNPVKGVGYIKCYRSSSTKHVKSPSNCTRYKCQIELLGLLSSVKQTVLAHFLNIFHLYTFRFQKRIPANSKNFYPYSQTLP